MQTRQVVAEFGAARELSRHSRAAEFCVLNAATKCTSVGGRMYQPKLRVCARWAFR
jgi:hypothetical protein